MKSGKPATIGQLDFQKNMRILFLSQILPYPPDAGPRVKTFEVLKHLVHSGHQVTLCAFVREDEKKHLGVLRELCNQVLDVPLTRSRTSDLWYWIRSHFTGRPFLIERDDRRSMRTCIDQELGSGRYDILYADQLSMTQFGFPRDTTRSYPFRIFDAHNATWKILDRMQKNANPALRPFLRLEASRVKEYEGKIIHSFDQTLVVTEVDRLALLDAAQAFQSKPGVADDQFTVIPISIDTKELRPAQSTGDSKHILTLGTLHYAPNAEGIRWFLKEVFPQVREKMPGIMLTIVGKNPPGDFIQISGLDPEHIRVTGYVTDLEPYYREAAVVVVPVLVGSGMRVRILEAFSRGKPVVTTTVGLEGIEAVPGEHILTADSAPDFSHAVQRLLNDKQLQSRLGMNGRRLVEQKYDPSVSLRALDSVLSRADTDTTKPGNGDLIPEATPR